MVKMKYTELKNSIKEGVQAIYLLEGCDGYFLRGGEEMIKSACLEMPELDFSTFDGAALSGSALTEFTAAIKNFPFGSQKRVVKVYEFYPSEEDYEKYLESTFENMPETSVVIIVNSRGVQGGKGKQGGKTEQGNQGGQRKKAVDLKRKKCVTYVDCNKADEDTVTRWVYITLKKSGVRCSEEAASAVAAYCLCDMSRVEIETKKLAAMGKPSITLADVDENVYKDADYRIYELTNAIPRKNYSAVCEITADLLRKGVNETVIISSMLTYFRNLYTISCSNESDQSLAETLKMKEYGVKKSRGQATAIGRAALKSHITALYRCASDFKSGLLSPEAALSMALNEIFFKTA